MALVGSHSQGGRSVNLRHGGESFRERGQGQWTDRDGSREYGNGEASVSAAAPVWVRWTPHPAPRLPPIPPITHGSVKPDGLTISLTAKDVAVGGNQRKLANKRGQIGDYVSGGSFDFNNEILDTKNIFFGNSESTDKPFNGPFALQVISRGSSVYKWISYADTKSFHKLQ